MHLVPSAKSMLLLLLGLFIRLRKREGGTSGHPKVNLPLKQFSELQKGKGTHVDDSGCFSRTTG